MSPNARTMAATERPNSSRKIRPTTALLILGAGSRSATWLGAGHLEEGPNLDRPSDAHRRFPRPRERLVEVGRVDDVEATKVLLRLGEGPVGRQRLPIGDRNDRGGLGAVETTGIDECVSGLHLLLELTDLPHESPH